jgi:methenyltetrahydromethanopterin cyclohydrolase
LRRVAVRQLADSARVIDAGIMAPGGLGAGLALAEVCMGGLGRVNYRPVTLGGEWAGYRCGPIIRP